MIITPTPAGDFNKRVQLVKRVTSTANELNELTTADQVVGNAWAKISPVSSTEAMANAENTLDITHEIRLRYTTLIGHGDAIRLAGRTLEIIDIRDIEEQHVELIVTCHEYKP